MSRNRFLLLLRTLHFIDNDNQYINRLNKIEPLSTYFNNKISNIYEPGENLSLDEF